MIDNKDNLAFIDDEALGSVLRDVSGRKVLWQLIERSHPLGMSFVAGQPDSTAFNEGMRFLGTNLLAQIMNNHESLYFQMIGENQKGEADGRKSEYDGEL